MKKVCPAMEGRGNTADKRGTNNKALAVFRPKSIGEEEEDMDV